MPSAPQLALVLAAVALVLWLAPSRRKAVRFSAPTVVEFREEDPPASLLHPKMVPPRRGMDRGGTAGSTIREPAARV